MSIFDDIKEYENQMSRPTAALKPRNIFDDIQEYQKRSSMSGDIFKDIDEYMKKEPKSGAPSSVYAPFGKQGSLHDRREEAEKPGVGETFMDVGSEALRKAGMLSGGIASGTGHIADALSYGADKVGADWYRDMFGNVAKYLNDYGAGAQRTAMNYGTGGNEQSFMDSLSSAVGSSLPSLAAGFALAPLEGAQVAGAALKAAQGAAAPGAVAAQAFRALSDSGGEAGTIMNKKLKEGATREEAVNAANKVFLANLPADSVLETVFGPFSGAAENVKGIFGRLLRGAIQGAGESLQEPHQDMAMAAAEKRNDDGSPLTWGQYAKNYIDELTQRGGQHFVQSGLPAAASAMVTNMLLPGSGGTSISEQTQQTQQTQQAVNRNAQREATQRAALEIALKLSEDPNTEARVSSDGRTVISETDMRKDKAGLLRWARDEANRMSEAAEFEQTPEGEERVTNALTEEDLKRYAELTEARKKKDFAALERMRGAQTAEPTPQAQTPVAGENQIKTPVQRGQYNDIDTFINAVTSPEGKKIASRMWVEMDGVSDNVADRVLSETGVDIHGYGHALDGSAFYHVLKRHGENGAALRNFQNQIPLNKEDFKQLPVVLSAPDSIALGDKSGDGNERILFKKQINGHFLVVEEARERLGKLIPVTMWKESASENKSGGVPHTSITPPTPGGPESATPLSTETVSPQGKNVNAGVNFKTIYDRAAAKLGRTDHITIKALREAAPDMDRAAFDAMIGQASDAGLIDLGADFVTGENADSVYRVARPGEDERDAARFGSVTWRGETSVPVKTARELMDRRTPEGRAAIKYYNEAKRQAIDSGLDEGAAQEAGRRAVEAHASGSENVSPQRETRDERYDDPDAPMIDTRDPHAQEIIPAIEAERVHIDKANTVQKAIKAMNSEGPEGKAARDIYNKAKNEAKARGMSDQDAQNEGFTAVAESMNPNAARTAPREQAQKVAPAQNARRRLEELEAFERDDRRRNLTDNEEKEMYDLRAGRVYAARPIRR